MIREWYANDLRRNHKNLRPKAYKCTGFLHPNKTPVPQEWPHRYTVGFYWSTSVSIPLFFLIGWFPLVISDTSATDFRPFFRLQPLTYIWYRRPSVSIMENWHRLSPKIHSTISILCWIWFVKIAEYIFLWSSSFLLHSYIGLHCKINCLLNLA